MSDIDFDLRVERVKKAADVIGVLPTEALQSEAFRYLLGEVALAAPLPDVAAPIDAGALPYPAKGKKIRRTSATKTAITQDRLIDLFPKGKVSFKDFATSKNPTNDRERYAVAVYWLREIAELGTATVAQVVSCYRVAEWSLPTNVTNSASQAAKAGYLSSGASEDLKLSSIGINLVDNTLPRAKA